ncbi:hypothetical protein EDB81DRAFT_857496 [Dactylonectria macrodidyma]|uniref:Uncharacterized protein n=1 Tax=Dactylonectria macrodidyma TaxID=307937 RepID=A0A9P9EPX2_9HYPO|nr:hypothetical protein EDB81DRAFT_857496 [Dactylonectria macrodidyma]
MLDRQNFHESLESVGGWSGPKTSCIGSTGITSQTMWHETVIAVKDALTCGGRLKAMTTASTKSDTPPFSFPAIHDLIRRWQHTFTWIQAEARDVAYIDRAREHQFVQRRRDPAYSEHSGVWTRWSLRDGRTDPEGAEAFCWIHGPVMTPGNQDRGQPRWP